MKTQGLLAHFLQQSGQRAPGFRLLVAQDFQLRTNGFDFGDRPGLIVIPGARLAVDLDHNQGGDDREDSQKQRRRSAGSALRRSRFPHKFLGLAQLVVNRGELGLELIHDQIGVRGGDGRLPQGRGIGRSHGCHGRRLAPVRRGVRGSLSRGKGRLGGGTAHRLRLGGNANQYI